MATVFGMCLMFIASAGRAESPEELRAFMQVKLQHSQKLLEGLVLEDLDRVAKHAQQLAMLSQESAWRVFQTEDYVQYSLEFRRAAHAIVAAAKEKNLDGATLAYMDVTMKCIKCHKYVRGIRMAGVDGKAALGPRLSLRSEVKP
ncbi:MAG: hypothetical protein GTO62_05665 [Planctomycetales bacterium]|nr:hypothetical protein [Planctomycetales bacterium]